MKGIEIMANLIVKDNILIEASHRLGETEQRLILLAILKARSQYSTVEQLQGKTLIIHADDYIRIFNVDKTTAYKALKKAVLGLFRAEWGYKYINDKGNKVVRYERFTQFAEYTEGDGTVSFKFADGIIPMLVELEKRFTAYEIKQVAHLSSQYAMRLYEFFIQHLDQKTGKGWFDISLDELRFRLGLLPTEYTLMSNFKNRVLDYAIEQINKNTDLSSSYIQKKQGRTIVGFTFTFKKKSKSQSKKSKRRDPYTPDLLDNLTDQEREIIAQKNAYADRIGATTEHRQNLINKALEVHKQAEQQAKEQQELEQTAQIAQQQAEAQQRIQAKQQSEQRKQNFVEMFESLDTQYQEQALDEVEKNYHNTILAKWFKEARTQGTAHTDIRFIGKFYELFGM